MATRIKLQLELEGVVLFEVEAYVQETWVWFLGQKDPLKQEMATHGSVLAWGIPWTDEPDGLKTVGLQRAGHDWATEHTQKNVYELLNVWWCYTDLSSYTLE